MRDQHHADSQNGKHREPITLHSKITVPSLPSDIIFRPRLIERLSNLSELPVTVVLSPAGYGKSCLVSHWAKRVKHSCAWLSLDKEDGTLDRFWAYFMAALCEINLELSDLHEQAYEISSEKTATVFIDHVISRLATQKRKLVFVMEDYHNLPNDSPVLNSLSYFINHIPDNVHLIITTRTFPKVGLHKVRIQGKLGIINENDLRFSLTEVEDLFFKGHRPLTLDESSHVHEYTKGWPVGVKLISFAYGAGAPGEHIALSGDVEQLIQDYLSEEVIERLSPAIQSFLEVTACLNSFSAELAEYLFDNEAESVMNIITYLKANSLFITDSVGFDGQLWYRYHALFSDAIYEQLSLKNRERVMNIRKKACRWYEEKGMFDEAVVTAALIRDYDQIRHIIIHNWRVLYEKDRLRNLLRWFQNLPEDYILNDPLLCLIQAAPLGVTGNQTLAIQRVRIAENFFGKKKDETYGLAMALKAIVFCHMGFYGEASEACDEALRFLPESEEYFREMTRHIIGGVKTVDEPEVGIAIIEDLLKQSIVQSNENLAVVICANLGNLYSITGDFNRCLFWAEKALEPYDPALHPMRAMLNYAYEAKLFVAYKQGDFARARSLAEYAVAHEHECWNAYSSARTHSVLAHIEFFGSEDEQAEKELVQSLKTCAFGFAWGYPSLVALQYWQKKELVTKDLFDEFAYRPNKDPLIWMATALDFCAEKEVNVSELLSHIAHMPPERMLAHLEYRLLAAAIKERNHEFASAEDLLEEALSIAESLGGADYAFIENAPYIHETLSRIAKRVGTSPATRLYQKLPARKMQTKTSDTSVSSLTAREKEVIHLVAAGLSTQDIADRLFVSTATVKKHLANIYVKLGVHGRVQAIAKLQEEKLLSIA